MDTLILTTSDADIATAGGILSGGGLVAFPTETVYGLGANALDASAAEKIYCAKGRPSDNPLIIHIADKADVENYTTDISESAYRLIETFMPGPFTIILKRRRIIPDTVTAGMETVAVRCPINETAQRLIEAAGVPIAAPSANLSGKPSPTKPSHVIADMDGRIDAIIDGGACDVGVESTIVDAAGDTPILLRPGGVTLEELRAVVPEIVADKHILSSMGKNEKPLCPGMKYKHYAPDAEVTVVEGDMAAVKKKINSLLDQNRGVICGVLTMSDNAYDSAVILSGGTTNKEYARTLFANLREFDRIGVRKVFAEFEGRDGYALAVRNRLYKAAAQRVIYV